MDAHVPSGARRPGDGALAVSAGIPAAGPNQPVMPGPAFASYYHLAGEPDGPYQYGRDSNPTWTLLEDALSTLESGAAGGVETVVFASGMAAASAVLLSQVRAGDVVALPSDCYYNVRGLRERLESYGVQTRFAPTAGDGQLAVLDGARLLWIETPSNPGLEVCDIRRLADAAHAAGALVAVDNTLATPLGQRPLDLGADLSVSSGTKALTGHGDVLLGHVSTRDVGLAESLRAWRKTVGAIPGPMEAWLAHRSLATLHLRADRQAANALALAAALVDRGDVTDVRHPGRPGDPAYPVASRQMRRYGCVVGFTLPDREHAERFLGGLRLVKQATSFGGVRSSAERRARWGGDDVAPGFVRFSCGVEDAADLVSDVTQALDAAATP